METMVYGPITFEVIVGKRCYQNVNNIATKGKQKIIWILTPVLQMQLMS